MVDIRIDAKEGFNVGMQNNRFVILNTELTDDLIKEGLAREFVSKIQNMRKEKGFEIENRIKLTYDGDEDILKAFDEFSEYIIGETLAIEYKNAKGNDTIDVNGHEVTVTIEKSNE